MSEYAFRPSNIPSYGLGVDFGSMDTKGTLYGQQPITKAGKYAVMSTPEYKSATPEIQKVMLETELGASSFGDVIKMANMFKPTLAEKEADLKIAGDFQARQQAAAAPYNMLYKGLDTLSKLPEQISTNAASRAMLNVIGAESAARAFNQTMASYPKTNFQSTVPLVEKNYFT
tara:strand:+ start:3675 stop:4193 length:519 start_codon:yes stop_codon:yes gene_type:complete